MISVAAALICQSVICVAKYVTTGSKYLLNIIVEPNGIGGKKTIESIKN